MSEYGAFGDLEVTYICLGEGTREKSWWVEGRASVEAISWEQMQAHQA